MVLIHSKCEFFLLSNKLYQTSFNGEPHSFLTTCCFWWLFCSTFSQAISFFL